MRNSLPYLSRVGATNADAFQQDVPTIRFTSATPHMTASNSAQDISSIAPFAYSAPMPHAPSPLAPRTNASPHKRIVPKKSKLGLLVSKPKLSTASSSKQGDLSDVVRRVGSSPSKRGYEIYVDRQDDPDLGEIMVVKKQKSRKGLNGMGWGALGEVTNVPSVPKAKKSQENLLKVPKGDENQSTKWWSIGRGRKDVKEKNGTLTLGSKENVQEPMRSKTPEPFKSSVADNGARFNSLDSGILLSDPPSRPSVGMMGTYSSSNTLLSVPEPGFLSAPPPENAGPGTGSIALRAMRSMRSIARMKSWANIAGDKEKEGNTFTSAMQSNVNTLTNVTNMNTKATTTKTKEKEGKTKKEKKAKEKKNKAKEKPRPNGRDSGSSFEVGALSPQSSPTIARTQSSEDGTKKNRLTLGIPSTLRLSAIRNLSSTSLVPSRAPTPVPAPSNTTNGPPSSARLSVDSARILSTTGRPSSLTSSGSSLRPASTVSAASTFEYRVARSSSSSSTSVRWDEEGLRGSREIQRRERREALTRKKEQDSIGFGRESRRHSDGRRRTAISEVFPEIQSSSAENSPIQAYTRPIVTVEEATVDGHSTPNDSDSTETPVRNVRTRPRPMSEQLLGKSRPRGISDEADVMLSVSDAAAATNELANLINWLDLEATPASSIGTPLRSSPLRRTPSTVSLGGKAGDGSPTKLRGMRYTFNKDTDALPLNTLSTRDSTASFASLRTYAAARADMNARAEAQANKAVPPTRQQAMDPAKARTLIGQQILPWSSLDWQVSPKKAPAQSPKDDVFRPGHKRTLTPAPAADPPVVFQPLRPAAKGRISSVVSMAVATPPIKMRDATNPSSQTFGSSSKPVKFGVECIDEVDYDEQSPSPSPTNGSRKGHRHARAASKVSILSALCDTGTPVTLETIKTLGLTGTLGGPEPDIDPEDPDSDIPEELQDILADQSDEEPTEQFNDTASAGRSFPPSPGMPPETPLPVFDADDADEEPELPMLRVTVLDENDNEADLDDPGSPSDSDTGKSFDFTGELKMLHESGASDRHSFVEQLENAFRTPARVDLDFHLGDRSLLQPDVPPVPPLPLEYRKTPGEDLVPQSVSEFDVSMESQDPEPSSVRDSRASDTLSHLLAECEDFCRPYGSVGNTPVSMRSRESDGRLNTSFKFGGTPSVPELRQAKQVKPLTLSDIIPPLVPRSAQPRFEDSSSPGNESSVLESIYAHACEDDTSAVNSVMEQAADPPVSRPRPRLDSDSSSKRRARNPVNVSGPWSHSRDASEASFNGFESFDAIRRGFEFGPNRPAFYPPPGVSPLPSHGRDESMYSMASVSSYGAVIHPGTVDPFGFGPDTTPSTDEASLSMSLTVDDTFSFLKKGPRRQRVDSDASSFYFGGLSNSRRGHRHNESNFSITSPPISLYNRSYGSHRRSDSSGSMSSIAHSYANNNRAAWARHKHDLSVDSIFSDLSVSHLARPGLGDKMFDSDYGMPLPAISGSPSGSTFDESEEFSLSGQPTSYDSIMDGNPRSSMVDSIFEQTGYKTTYSNVDVFDMDVSQPAPTSRHLRAPQFRPVSILSLGSVSETIRSKEDDTMISMLGGGHVRRRSVDAWVEHSPSQGRKATGLQMQYPGRVLQFEDDQSGQESDRMPVVSPEKVIHTQPSIASTSEYKFGGERMIKARKGLLERQSLEESALMAQGEELLATFNSSRVFARPAPISRSRSSTVTSGSETPQLSLSDGSSMSGGSQSSIDLGSLNDLLTASVQPSSGITRARSTRVRARGTGHRRRISQARASRSSVYETIQEEAAVLSYSPPPTRIQELSNLLKTAPAAGIDNSVYIVDADTASISDYDDEHGIVTLRKYHALKDEAHETVTESKKAWTDTPFSIFAVQSFEPPSNKDGMTAMLEHSKQTYGPLPSELRPHRVRSRTSSRASPYPVRGPLAVLSPGRTMANMSSGRPFASPRDRSLALRSISIDPNISLCPAAPPVDVKPFSPIAVELEKSKEGKLAAGAPRQRVTSSARRSALGWKKRGSKAGAGADKENARPDMIIAPSDSLRLSRPRPRGRPTPALKAVSAR